jgi:hypothetical protein
MLPQCTLPLMRALSSDALAMSLNVVHAAQLTRCSPHSRCTNYACRRTVVPIRGEHRRKRNYSTQWRTLIKHTKHTAQWCDRSTARSSTRPVGSQPSHGTERPDAVLAVAGALLQDHYLQHVCSTPQGVCTPLHACGQYGVSEIQHTDGPYSLLDSTRVGVAGVSKLASNAALPPVAAQSPQKQAGRT